jgi:hypothetical protein
MTWHPNREFAFSTRRSKWSKSIVHKCLYVGIVMHRKEQIVEWLDSS